MPNQLFYGDNLAALREHIPDESVDLVYLDPPFNSNTRYNVLFTTPGGEPSNAQVEAFMDTWRWSEEAATAYDEVVASGSIAAEILRSLRVFLHQSDMMAYLCMMTVRLIELHRVLKPTGSLYLHCDPTASHYLKIVLDGIFGGTQFVSEIVWKRSSAHSDGKQGRRQHGRIHDVLLLYSKGKAWTWNQLYTPYDQTYVDNFYRYVEPSTGRRYRLGDLTGPGGAAKGNPKYAVMGVQRYWRYSKEKMQALIDDGRVVQTSPGTVPAYKRYLDEMPGVPIQDLWTDIPPVSPQAKERLGYPTQKPLALLERIIGASTNPGDIVLDPFCGCGTTIHAAELMGRQWLGIDVTHYAVSLIEARLRASFATAKFEVRGRPTDMDGVMDLARRDKYQFQWWANWKLGVQSYEECRKGPDRGIDGNIFFKNGPSESGAFGRVLISVKGGENVGVGAVRDLLGTVTNEGADLGVLVTLAKPTRPMLDFARSTERVRTAHGDFRKIQIVTAEELVNGELPDLPKRHEMDTAEQVTARRKRRSGGDPQLSFLLSVTGSKGKDGSSVRHLAPDLLIGRSPGAQQEIA